MSKIRQILRSLFNKDDTGKGRYKAVVNESYRLNNNGLRTCVFAQRENDIVPNVKRRTKNSHANKIEIVNVFYQATKGGYFQSAHLSENTKQAIDTFNKTGDKQDIYPGL